MTNDVITGLGYPRNPGSVRPRKESLGTLAYRGD